jgi:hypothetical protein
MDPGYCGMQRQVEMPQALNTARVMPLDSRKYTNGYQRY